MLVHAHLISTQNGKNGPRMTSRGIFTMEMGAIDYCPLPF